LRYLSYRTVFKENFLDQNPLFYEESVEFCFIITGSGFTDNYRTR